MSLLAQDCADQSGQRTPDEATRTMSVCIRAAGVGSLTIIPRTHGHADTRRSPARENSAGARVIPPTRGAEQPRTAASPSRWRFLARSSSPDTDRPSSIAAAPFRVEARAHAPLVQRSNQTRPRHDTPMRGRRAFIPPLVTGSKETLHSDRASTGLSRGSVGGWREQNAKQSVIAMLGAVDHGAERNAKWHRDDDAPAAGLASSVGAPLAAGRS